jgi:hypothetical protein
MSVSDNSLVKKLEEALKEMSFYEKKGFDASSLKIFIKNFKEYLRVTGQTDPLFNEEELTFDKKLEIIQTFLEDRKAFPTIKEVIEFANNNLNLDFRDQKESRDITISRIISRIRTKPDLKEKLKTAVLSIRNEKVHNTRPRTKKEIVSAETFTKWAEIIKNI